MSKKTFTLLELIIVMVIVAILAGLGISQYQGAIIKARIAEIYPTLSAIYKAEELFYLQNGYHASADEMYSPPQTNYPLLGYLTSQGQDQIDQFSSVLGINIPGVNSQFIYGVHYAGSTDPANPAAIYVRVRNNFGAGKLCVMPIEGANRGKVITSAPIADPGHPWHNYVKADQ
jgi:prepilin-type N-terminal cleavage/methylation domain-containing protein